MELEDQCERKKPNRKRKWLQGNTKNSTLDSSNTEETDYELATKSRRYSLTEHEPSDCHAQSVPADAIIAHKRKFICQHEDNNLKRAKNHENTSSDHIKESGVHFTETDGHGDVFLSHPRYVQSDLFCSDEKKCNYELFKKQDLLYYLSDEVSLEGLDGITIEAFLKRYAAAFPVHLNKKMIEYLWRILCNNKRIQFYELKEPREKYVSYDCYKYMDYDLGAFQEPPEEVREIYPYCPVNIPSIKGSCSAFHNRKEIHELTKYTSEKTQKLYGQKLVFVADQLMRTKAIINEESDPINEYTDIEYCILERLGRSRQHGELAQGKISLQSFLNDSTGVYHNRKLLHTNFLIMFQFFHTKSYTTQQSQSRCLVQLSRFYNQRKSKYLLIAEQFAEILRQKPDYQIEYAELRRRVAEQNISIKNLLKLTEFQKFFKSVLYNYRELYPNAAKREWICKKGHKEKQIRVLKLIDPSINVAANFDLKSNNQAPIFEAINENKNMQTYCGVIKDIYSYILSKGREGVTIHEISEDLQTDFYTTRSVIRKLGYRNLIDSHKVDIGRQQTSKFFVKSLTHITSTTTNTDRKVFNKLRNSVFLKALKDHTKNHITATERVSNNLVSLKVVSKNMPQNLLNESNSYQLDLDYKSLINFNKGEANIFENRIAIYDLSLLKQSNIFEDFLKDIYSLIEFQRVSNDLGLNIKSCSNVAINKTSQFKNNYRNAHSSKRFDDFLMKSCLLQVVLTNSKQALSELDEISNKLTKNESGLQSKIVEKLPEFDNITSNVVMEKFMGSNPILIFHEINDDNIKTEIYNSTEPLKIVENATKYSDTNSSSITKRTINRANRIIKFVNDEKVVKIDYMLRIIRNEEIQRGYTDQICKKSLKRILTKLVTDGYLKIFKIVVKGNNLIRIQYFICHFTVTMNHSIIKSALEQLKMKLFITLTTKKVFKPIIKIKTKNYSPFNSIDVKDSILQLKNFNDVTIKNTYKYDRSIGRILGYRPKFLRMRVLHEYLFYLVYDLVETKPLARQEINKLCDRFHVKLEKNDINSMPEIYSNEISWKMFIHSLPIHKGWPTGWVLACDILLRLPLSLFVKLYNITYNIPEIDEYIKHPIKQHFLIKFLPSNLRSVLLNRRKYFTSIYETVVYLCYIGLVQMGPKKFKDREQIFFYLNKKATLFDTSTSGPGYNYIEKKKYKKLSFNFISGDEVDRYWCQMWKICMNTPLGKRKVMDGKSVVIEDPNTKPSLMKTLKVKNCLTATDCDTGKIPGDHRGAAGLDSSLWAYVKRNWSWNSKLKKKSSSVVSEVQADVKSLKKAKLDNIVLPQPIKYGEFIKQNLEEAKVYLNPVKQVVASVKKNSKLLERSKKYKKNKIVIRTIIAPKKRCIREYHDNLDKIIMKNNRHTKVEWDPMEDRLLSLSRAACTFICPNSKKQFIPYNVIRDVLHRINPKSLNKTARACQRRIYLLLLSDEDIQIMDANVENLLNSYVVSKYFSKIFSRYKNETDNIKFKDNEIYIAYIYLMSYLIKYLNEIELLLLGYVATIDYFSEPYINLFELILESFHENNSKYYTNPNTEIDIKKDTIKSIVHSSLLSKTNNPNWNWQLFHIYRKYSDEQIRSVIGDLKKNQFLSSTKGYTCKDTETSWNIPLQLSNLYNSMLPITYSSQIFQESYQKFQIILNDSATSSDNSFVCYNELNSFLSHEIDFKFDIPEIGTILNPNLDDHNEVIEELSLRFHLLLKKVYERECERQTESNKNVDDSNQLDNEEDDNNKKSNETVEDKEKEIVELKNYVMGLIFRVPYFVEGNLENYFKQMMDSFDELEINKYIFLVIKELVNIAKTFEGKIVEENDFFNNALGEEFNDSLTREKLTSTLSKIVYDIQNVMKEKYNESNNDNETNSEEVEKIQANNNSLSGEENQSNDTSNETVKSAINSESSSEIPTGTAKDMDNEQQIRQLPFIPGIVLDSRNVNNGMSYCIKRALTGDIPSLEEIKEGIMVKINPDENRTIPHITDLNVLLTKELFPDLDTDEETIERFKEHFVMQYPTLQEFVINNIGEVRDNYLVKYLQEKICNEEIREKAANDSIIKAPQLEKITGSVSDIINDLEFVEAVIAFIKDKQQFGASAEQLRNNFVSTSTLNLISLLKYLTEINVILRTGITSLTFVYYEFQSVWLLETFLLNADEEEMLEINEKDETLKSNLENEAMSSSDQLFVRVMPWVKLDGTINEQEFEKWLCTILSHCLDYPNISLPVLCDKFCYIKPVDIFYLLEYLQELGCIELLLYTKNVSTLFSKRTVVECNKLATCLDDFEDIYISTNNVTALSIGSYLNSKQSVTV